MYVGGAWADHTGIFRSVYFAGKQRGTQKALRAQGELPDGASLTGPTRMCSVGRVKRSCHSAFSYFREYSAPDGYGLN